MKFICTQENLLKGLNRVTPVAGRNRQLPILSHVLIQLKDGVMHLTSTDLELGVHTIVVGKVEVEGSATVPARKLTDYVQQLPAANPLTVERRGQAIHIKTKGYQAQFPAAGDEDFPLLPSLPSEDKIEMSAPLFCRGLTRTMFAAAKDETRPEIRSVLVRGNEKAVTMAATDSFRLVEEVMPLKGKGVDFSFLLPLPTAQEIVRLFADQERIELLPSENHLVLLGDTTELSSRLVDGKYPDYQQIIPRTFSAEGSLDREAVIRALKTLLVFLPRDSRRVRMNVKPEAGIVAMSVGGGESGEGSVELDFEGQGGDFEVLFNIQYLLDGMQNIQSERVAARFVGVNDPGVFGPAETEEGAGYTYVVMPIQSS